MAILYRDTAEPAVPTPPLGGDARADVVVVGGGITGLSTALHAAEAGAKVIVLEAQDPGWGASGRNGGQVNAGLKLDPDIVERDFGVELGRRMNTLAGAAPAFVFDLIERHSIRCEARQNGTLRAAVRAQHAAKIRISVDQWLRRNAPVEFLNAAAVERVTGTGHYIAAMFDRRGGDLNPLSFARGLARAAIGAGAQVHGGTRALSLTSSGQSLECAHRPRHGYRRERGTRDQRLHRRALAKIKMARSYRCSARSRRAPSFRMRLPAP